MGREDAEAEIDAIERDGDIHGVPSLVEFLPPESNELGGRAVMALEAVFRRAKPDELAQLDAGFRGYGALAPPAGRSWMDIQIARAPCDRRNVALVALATMHRNGFVRQSAVELLATTRDGLGLPFLLLRANDWNDNVRRAAFAALASWSTATFAAEWLACMPLLIRRTHESRNHAALSRLRTSIEALLRGTESRGALVEALRRREPTVAREAVRIASDCTDESVLPILRQAMGAADPSVAMIAARALVAREAYELDAMCSHSIARIRSLGLEAAALALGAAARPVLERALLDANASVRAAARHELSRLGFSCDWARFYRAALADGGGSVRSSAADGLSETGGAADIATLRAWLTSPAWRVRVAGLRGVARIDPSGHLAVIEAALDDRSWHVRHAARPLARLYLGRSALRRK